MQDSIKTISPAARGISVQYLKGVGPGREKLLRRLGIETLKNLVDHFPRDWQDRRPVLSFPSPGGASFMAAYGRVIGARALSAGMRLSLFKAELMTPAGKITAVWFKYKNRNFDVLEPLKKEIIPGADVWVIGHGEVSLSGHCEIRVEEHYLEGERAQLHVNRLVPLYPLTEGLSQKFFREIVAQALPKIQNTVLDIIPPSIESKRRLLSLGQALAGIHFPGSKAELDQARRRLAYEELLLLGLAWDIKRHQTREMRKGFSYSLSRHLLTPFKNRLGFDLTHAQKRVINEIFTDMRENFPMSRLLQGDVGSGKTVVAISALLLAVENGAQTALMAPSEILAEQHMATLSKYLSGLPVKIQILTSRLKGKERSRAIEKIRNGEIDIAVGTHALIEEDVVFKNLRLAVIDEQHRFGVRQRATLKRKGNLIDLLVMTATPIPRTLALALYGDLDISTIDEMPPGREIPKTFFASEEKALEAVKREILKGHQAYIVYPVIEESEKKDLQSAKAEFKRLSETVFAGFPVALIHGALKSAEKIKAMEDFNAGKTKILVATQVIEIGIDVPNASVMVIQNAERFGLASLHQLRGRIGRGSLGSECYLVGNPSTEEGRRRIEIMLGSHDGFNISEEDLRLRGVGELLGTTQHGELGLRVADISRDVELLKQAREDSAEILAHDFTLQNPMNQGLRLRLREIYQERWNSIDLA